MLRMSSQVSFVFGLFILLIVRHKNYVFSLEWCNIAFDALLSNVSFLF